MDEKNKQTRSPVYGVGGFVYDVTIIGRVPFNYLIAFVILCHLSNQSLHNVVGRLGEGLPGIAGDYDKAAGDRGCTEAVSEHLELFYYLLLRYHVWLFSFLVSKSHMNKRKTEFGKLFTWLTFSQPELSLQSKCCSAESENFSLV